MIATSVVFKMEIASVLHFIKNVVDLREICMTLPLVPCRQLTSVIFVFVWLRQDLASTPANYPSKYVLMYMALMDLYIYSKTLTNGRVIFYHITK